MTLLGQRERTQVRDHLAKRMDGAVTVRLFTQLASPLTAPTVQCETCRDTEQLLRELTELSDRLRLEVRDLVADADEARRLGVEHIPTIVLEGKNAGVLRYVGVPAGYEFAVLLEDLGDVSRGSTGLTAATRERLASLPGPVEVKVLVTPT
ncbi:MAG TPA: thioredoxin family protein [Candidatus Dormibacteraeota bacterium]|nr:thioredoxin family protein [Candidatus Dormibacteraeota bacterium]